MTARHPALLPSLTALALVLPPLAAMPAAAAAGNAPAPPGAELAASCAACHRDDAGAVAIPSLAGLDQTSLVAMLRDYRSGQRRNQIMQVVASALTPQEIHSVAAYLAARQPDQDR